MFLPKISLRNYLAFTNYFAATPPGDFEQWLCSTGKRRQWLCSTGKCEFEQIPVIGKSVCIFCLTTVDIQEVQSDPTQSIKHVVNSIARPSGDAANDHANLSYYLTIHNTKSMLIGAPDRYSTITFNAADLLCY